MEVRCAVDDKAGIAPRVLFVNHSSKLGGAELILLSILEEFDEASSVWLFEEGPLRTRLEQKAVRTVLATRRSGFSEVTRNGSLLRALPFAVDILKMAGDIGAYARSHEVIYANSQKAFVCGAAAATLARRPLIWHLHDIVTPAHYGKGQLRLQRALARLASRVIVPSKAAADAFSQLCGGKRKPIIVSNGVTLAPDEMAKASRDERRRHLGLPTGFVVGVFSRLSPWKAQHILLQALKDVSDANCIVVGEALFGETRYAESLRSLAQDLGVAERVHFLGFRSDVASLMRAVDVVVHPSVDPEPFGRTLVEAMLCRTPLIATDTGAAAEILADGRAGLLVAPRNPSALVSAINEIRANPAAASSRASFGEQRALALFTEEQMRNGILRVVRDVIPPYSC
ncbi:glycosyltransferase [Paracraurococcus lichenis]|uniref:Glycosyltransferase n=1 Tax=Paracraurococcus lichenis TaxID=3064888 RepID=A0ABT9EBF0_9PROT|nr:glycosyltransferase [Paracraurococcus sp. LOR1-02]MDO9713360.1 glycosyltransferase [Paracraurococcus sp. LOR1-02]